MACGGKVLVTIVAVFLGLVDEQQVRFVNGDRQLILQVCSNTPNATTCDKCLTYTPGSINTDLKGLGRASIICASQESRKALLRAYEMEEILDPSDTCISKLQAGDKQIADALDSWREGRYADAATQVQAGASTARECSDGLKKDEQPKDLVDLIATLQSVRDVAAGVLRQIH